VAADGGVPPKDLERFLHLAGHAIGEHLGDWPRAFRLGKRILDDHVPTVETGKAWGRLYAAAVLAGDYVAATEAEVSYLKTVGNNYGAAMVDMRLMLVGSLIGAKRARDAARLYRGALDLVEHVPSLSLLDREIAVESNNLGWEIYEQPSRNADEDGLMRLCAETSLKFWLKCGDWIREERALYLRAMVYNATGTPASGLDDANRAIAVINSNGERPLDTALLHLARARSLGAMGDSERARAAIRDGDVAATKITQASLRSQFDMERARPVFVELAAKGL
jgi:hypothetical protein